MTRILALLISVSLAACNYSGKSEYLDEKILKATRVRLDVEQGGRNAVVEGDELQLNLDTLEMDLSGNASVSMGEPVYFRADAVKISFKESFEVIELEGDVQAYVGVNKQDEIDGKSPRP